MENIGHRIKQVIDSLGISQAEFAKKVNISQSMVSKICSGSAEPSYRTISDICKNFGIDVIWLETGIGEMFNKSSEDELLALFLGQTLGGVNDPIYRQFALAIAESTPEELQAIKKFAAKLLDSDNHEKETAPDATNIQD